MGKAPRPNRGPDGEPIPSLPPFDRPTKWLGQGKPFDDTRQNVQRQVAQSSLMLDRGSFAIDRLNRLFLKNNGVLTVEVYDLGQTHPVFDPSLRLQVGSFQLSGGHP